MLAAVLTLVVACAVCWMLPALESRAVQAANALQDCGEYDITDT